MVVFLHEVFQSQKREFFRFTMTIARLLESSPVLLTTDAPHLHVVCRQARQLPPAATFDDRHLAKLGFDQNQAISRIFYIDMWSDLTVTSVGHRYNLSYKS